MAVASFIMMLIYSVILPVSIGIAIVQLIAMWKLYEKAGEPGWTSIIPFYNYFKMLKIALGSYKLAWIYAALCGGHLILAFASAIFVFYIETSNEFNHNELEMMRFALTAVAYMLTIPLYIIGRYANYMFSKSYGKSTALCVLSIFFSGIMMIIFGFDKNTYYVGPKGIPAA